MESRTSRGVITTLEKHIVKVESFGLAGCVCVCV